MAILLAWPSTADAGRIHNRPVTLEAVFAKWIPHILVVTPAEPASRSVEIPVDGGAEGKCGADCPSFNVHISRYIVREVLHVPKGAQGGGDLVGETLEVVPAGLGSSYGLHWQYYVEGLSKSPIVHRYERASASDPHKDPKGFIVFLARNGSERRGDLAGLPEWSFSIRGGIEGLDQRAKILELLRERLGAPPGP